MRESEYERARREIRALDSALHDYCSNKTTDAPVPSFLSILYRRSVMAYRAVDAVKLLPMTAYARYRPGAKPQAQDAACAIVDAFEALGLFFEGSVDEQQ